MQSEKIYTMKNYEKEPPFAGFLPGLSGIYGTPIWCYYVNRGQCISSFGVEDKDHAIIEFFPAHQAYQYTAQMGFRTFVKKNGKYLELFSDEGQTKEMHIKRNGLSITEKNEQEKIACRVDYFTLPNERTGALVRKVGITNLSAETIELQVLDGLPAVIPYGVAMADIKEMGQTTQAWMQAEDVETGVPFFRVRASMNDTATVTEVLGGNYGVAFDAAGQKKKVIADAELLFSYDSALQKPVGFLEQDFEELMNREQVNCNQYPCCFFAETKSLKAGETVTLYELYGQVERKEFLIDFLNQKMDGNYFEQKQLEADRIPEELCSVIDTRTGNADFDAYTAYTYMDNVLRGGKPVVLPGNHIFYIYSRKHGDLERDYNYFRMLPEFYSQGNGNFRDVNQNRRCDNFFTPYVGTENICKFYGLVQLDGYNPLSIEKVTYELKQEDIENIFGDFSEERKAEMEAFFQTPFTPGGFFRKLYEIGIKELEKEKAYFDMVMEKAVGTTNADFGEGYWSDHWDYNLDLIENYLNIFPEQEEQLLFHTPITYFRSQAKILPRKKRYVKTEHGIRQYHFLDKQAKVPDAEKLLRDQYGKGEVITSTLMEKLLVLCTTKFAALDAYGMGVEMEGGKPGWYDALNGMPGLFGSSMAETYELSRMLTYTLSVVEKYEVSYEVLTEVAEFLYGLDKIVCNNMNGIIRNVELLEFWNERNDLKENYWEKCFAGVCGRKTVMKQEELRKILVHMQAVVTHGIRKAVAIQGGECPTYFTYDVKKYTEDEEGITVEQFEVVKMPLFLEGPVRYLKLEASKKEKQMLYDTVKKSGLYDQKLQMYKVNASLKDASFELGRAKAFTPGWLENESIWLHMEYKYLLELLKSGLYQEFADDFHKAAIPFLNEKKYGRSIYENSSFLASSANPNESYHGRGFVARLSGSTVEFLQMWILMMFGNVFQMENAQLVFSLTPVLPSYLIGEDKCVEAMLLGTTKVIYQFADKKDYFPGNYEICSQKLYFCDGRELVVNDTAIRGKNAEEIRMGNVTKIVVTIK